MARVAVTATPVLLLARVLVLATIGADQPPEMVSAASRHAAGFMGGGVEQFRIDEADRIAAAAASAIAALPFGHAARDELRALRGKLASLRTVASLTDPAEWDAMLSALLQARYSGVDDLTALLTSHAAVPAGDLDALAQVRPRASEPAASAAAAAAEGCEEDAAPESPGRRLAQRAAERAAERATPAAGATLPPPVPASERRAKHAASGPPPLHREEDYAQQRQQRQQQQQQQQQYEEVYDEGYYIEEVDLYAGPYHWGLAGRVVWGWRRWLLDRPPPWERDCDCCFPACPAGHHCLLQGDGLYLACRGDSLGTIVDFYWTTQPLTMALTLLVLVLSIGGWLVQQALTLRSHVRSKKLPEPRSRGSSRGGAGSGASGGTEEEEEDDDEEEEDDDEAEADDDEAEADDDDDDNGK